MESDDPPSSQLGDFQPFIAIDPQPSINIDSHDPNIDSSDNSLFPIAAIFNAHVPPSALASDSFPLPNSLSQDLLSPATSEDSHKRRSSSESSVASDLSWVRACEPLLQPASYNLSQIDLTKQIQSTNFPATQQSESSTPMCTQFSRPSTSTSLSFASNSFYPPKDDPKITLRVKTRDENQMTKMEKQEKRGKGIDTDSTSSETREELDNLLGPSPPPSQAVHPEPPHSSPVRPYAIDKGQVLPRTQKGSVQSKPQRSTSKKKRSFEEPKDFKPTTVSCPGCSTSLEGRIWKGKSYQSRTEVATPNGWALVNLSGDLVLPCSMCLVKDEGKSTDKWREASLSSYQFFNRRINRFRQHLKIKHGLNASEEKGQEIRDYGKALQCQYLHGQEVHSDCAFETDSDEMTEDLFKLPPNAPSVAETAKKLAEVKLSPPPPGWISWLEKGKCIKSNTIKVYSHIASQFLAVMKITNPNKPASIKMAWDRGLCTHFFSTMSLTVCASTIVNYHNALIAIRAYLKRVNQAPDDFYNIMEDFKGMLQNAVKQKNIYIEQRKELKEGHQGMLWLAYNRIYHNLKYVRRFYKIADRFKKGNLKAGEHYVDPLTREELYFCNAFLMFVLFLTSFHRPGNLAQIEFSTAKKEVLRARRKLVERFPGIDVKLNGRVDRTRVEAAIIRVDGAMKSGGTIKFVLLNPRDQDLVTHYFHIRENCPKPITTTKLFVNARGTSVKQNISGFIRKLGEMAKIRGLSCQMLRALIETENVLEDSPAQASVSKFLGHKTETRKKYYELKDKRHFVQDSNRLLWKLEDIGEVENPENITSAVDASLDVDAKNDGSANDDSDSAVESDWCANSKQSPAQVSVSPLENEQNNPMAGWPFDTENQEPTNLHQHQKYSIPKDIPTFQPTQISLVSLMEASPSFSFIDPRESSQTESGETLAGLHGDSGKTDSGKEDAKETEDSAFIEPISSSDEEAQAFHSAPSNPSSSPLHSAKDFSGGSQADTLEENCTQQGNLCEFREILQDSEFELDDLNPPSSSRQVGDEIDDELQLVLQDSPSRQELLSSLKRKPLKRKPTGYSESSDGGSASDSNLVMEIFSSDSTSSKPESSKSEKKGNPGPLIQESADLPPLPTKRSSRKRRLTTAEEATALERKGRNLRPRRNKPTA